MSTGITSYLFSAEPPEHAAVHLMAPLCRHTGCYLVFLPMGVLNSLCLNEVRTLFHVMKVFFKYNYPEFEYSYEYDGDRSPEVYVSMYIVQSWAKVSGTTRYFRAGSSPPPGVVSGGSCPEIPGGTTYFCPRLYL